MVVIGHSPILTKLNEIGSGGHIKTEASGDGLLPRTHTSGVRRVARQREYPGDGLTQIRFIYDPQIVPRFCY